MGKLDRYGKEGVDASDCIRTGRMELALQRELYALL